MQRNPGSVINLGVDSSVFWIRCTIINNTDQQVSIELGNPMLTDIRLYELVSDRVIASHHAGILLPFNNRDFKSVNFQFELASGPHSTEVLLLRVQNYRGTHFPLVAGDRQALFNQGLTEDLMQGTYYGIIIAMILYNLFIYFTLKDISYIYYVTYMLSMGVWNATIHGYAFKYFYPNLPFLNQYADITAGLLGITAILFATNFLDTRKNAPLSHKIFIGLMVGFIALIGVILLGHFYAAAFVLDTISLLVVLCFFITAYIILNRNYRPAKFFLIAWSLLLLSLVVFILKDINVIPYSPLTASSMQIGSTIEAVLLSMALANRINIYKNEKEQAQQETLHTLKANQRLIEEKNVILEGKIEIQERAFMKIGQEIHDNIGQILTLAKMNLSPVRNESDLPKIEAAKDLITKALKDLRDLSKTLNTDQVVRMGILKAIQMELDMVGKTGMIETSFNETGENRPTNPKQELIIFRIIQESIQNVIKHANARSIDISACYESHALKIIVCDDGVGFNVEEKMGSGAGLANMKSRASVIGAALAIDSDIGKGTTICISLPYIDSQEIGML
jgi:signal transduction histidine kinase